MGQIQSTYTPFFNSCWNTWIIWFKKKQLWAVIVLRELGHIQTERNHRESDTGRFKKKQKTTMNTLCKLYFLFFFIRFLEIQPKTTSLTCLVLMGNRWPQFTQKCSSVTTWSSDFINGLSYDHVFFFFPLATFNNLAAFFFLAVLSPEQSTKSHSC